MKALALDLKNDKPIVEMRDMPVPKIASDEVLVKVKAVSICGTDISVAEYVPAMRKRIKKMPHILGHEFAGKIVKLGVKVDPDRWRIGDCVSAETHIYCGKCSVCERGDKNLCPDLSLLGVDCDGCFAEYIAVPEKILWKNDDSIPCHLASAQEPLGNAVYCVDEAGVADKSILIIGDGPAALFVVAVAKRFGAANIVVFGYNYYRLRIAEKIGAFTKNCANIDFVVSGADSFDIVFEMTGSESGINTAINACRYGGKIMVFGLSKDDSVFVPYNKIAFKGITAQGIYGRRLWNSWGKTRWLLNDSYFRVVMELIVTHKLPFAEWQKGFDLMIKTKNCGKIVLSMKE